MHIRSKETTRRIQLKITRCFVYFDQGNSFIFIDLKLYSEPVLNMYTNLITKVSKTFAFIERVNDAFYNRFRTPFVIDIPLPCIIVTTKKRQRMSYNEILHKPKPLCCFVSFAIYEY